MPNSCNEEHDQFLMKQCDNLSHTDLKFCIMAPNYAHSIVHFVPTAKTLTLADLPVLQSKLQTISGLWYPLGVELQLEPNVLGGIPRVAGNDTAACLSVMLMQWLQRKDRPPTLDALINSLDSPKIGDHHLAQSLKNEGIQS